MRASAGATDPPLTLTVPQEEHWRALMGAAQAGESRPYQRLLEEVRKWLVRYYSKRLPPGMIEDAVQETLIAIHEKRHTYDPDRPFKPWLAAVARYKWIDRLRSMNRHPTDELPDDLAVDDHGSAVMSAEILRQLMVSLKPAQAEAIRLVKIEGFSVEEASSRTGQSLSLIKVNIHRGLARLAAMVHKDPGVD